MRRRTYSPPNARPKMNALSINSNEWVELPRTRLSIRIQPSSYMNDAAPVSNAATVNHLVKRVLPRETVQSADTGAAAGSVLPANDRPDRQSQCDVEDSGGPDGARQADRARSARIR